MDPRPILTKPTWLPALPAYEKVPRQLLLMLLPYVIQPVLITAVVFYLGLERDWLGWGAIALTLVLGPYLLVNMAKRRSGIIAAMAGEEPFVRAHEVDGGFVLRTGRGFDANRKLLVKPGDIVTVVVAPARNPRQPSRQIGAIDWSFSTGTAAPLVVRTWFDPDAAVLRDVENAIKGLGATVEITHTPFDAS